MLYLRSLGEQASLVFCRLDWHRLWLADTQPSSQNTNDHCSPQPTFHHPSTNKALNKCPYPIVYCADQPSTTPLNVTSPDLLPLLPSHLVHQLTKVSPSISIPHTPPPRLKWSSTSDTLYAALIVDLTTLDNTLDVRRHVEIYSTSTMSMTSDRMLSFSGGTLMLSRHRRWRWDVEWDVDTLTRTVRRWDVDVELTQTSTSEVDSPTPG